MAENIKIGGVNSTEVEALMKSQSDIVDPAEVDRIGRFCQNVAKLLVLRRKKETKDFCIFVLWSRSDKPTIDALVNIPHVGNGNDAISGDIWLTNHALNHNSWKLPDKAINQDNLHEELENIALSQFTTIVVDWRTGEPQAQVLIGGVSGQESLKLHLEDEPISLLSLKTVMDSIYENNFRNPTVVRSSEHGKLWVDAAKGWPAPKPEAVIQGQIKTALQTAFPLHDTKPEIINDDGRADLIISRKVKSELGHPTRRTDWLLEFKALRDKTPTGKKFSSPTPSEALNSGITQLLGYSPHVDPLERSLCCFDLRENDEGDGNCFACIESISKEKQIHTWRWYCHRSTPAAREARYGEAAREAK
jgi:hypothetical protein